MSRSHGSSRPITACDRECAAVNGCSMGGEQCAGCGMWFCSTNLDENGYCDECAAQREQDEDEEAEMANEQETIADIVREMWKMQERTSIVLAVRGYAKRIDEAYKRDTGDCEACLHKHPQCADCPKVAAVECERNDLRRENERLRRALKPVLDCHLCDGGQQVVSDALCAIREAKEIMKGETNDD